MSCSALVLALLVVSDYFFEPEAARRELEKAVPRLQCGTSLIQSWCGPCPSRWAVRDAGIQASRGTKEAGGLGCSSLAARAARRRVGAALQPVRDGRIGPGQAEAGRGNHSPENQRAGRARDEPHNNRGEIIISYAAGEKAYFSTERKPTSVRIIINQRRVQKRHGPLVAQIVRRDRLAF